jgi:predicted RNase H-like nuclease
LTIRLADCAAILAEMAVVAGVDAYKRGWVAVVLEDGAFNIARVFPTITELLSGLEASSVIGVDIPIGLPTSARRAADAEARAFVGPRGSSVFPTPPRAVIEADTYDEARRVAKEQFGIGVSSQSYRGLREKILQVDAVIGSDDRLIEVHPEVSFRALADHDLQYSKRTWNGQMERRRLLEEAGIEVPDDLGEAAVVPVDDVLDAAVGAWTAARYEQAIAQSFPNPPEIDNKGRAVAIWY